MPTDAICDGHEETEHGINCARSETPRPRRMRPQSREHSLRPRDNHENHEFGCFTIFHHVSPTEMFNMIEQPNLQ